MGETKQNLFYIFDLPKLLRARLQKNNRFWQKEKLNPIIKA